MCEFFRGLVKDHHECKKPGAKNDNNVIKKCLGAAYELTLTKYHGMASRLLVKVSYNIFPISCNNIPSIFAFSRVLPRPRLDLLHLVLELWDISKIDYSHFREVRGQLFKTLLF